MTLNIAIRNFSWTKKEDICISLRCTTVHCSWGIWVKCWSGSQKYNLEISAVLGNMFSTVNNLVIATLNEDVSQWTSLSPCPCRVTQENWNMVEQCLCCLCVLLASGFYVPVSLQGHLRIWWIMGEQCLCYGCFWLVASLSPCLAYLAGSTHLSRHIHSPPPNSYSNLTLQTLLLAYYFLLFAPLTSKQWFVTFWHHMIFAIFSIAHAPDSLNPTSCPTSYRTWRGRWCSGLRSQEVNLMLQPAFFPSRAAGASSSIADPQNCFAGQNASAWSSV